MSAHAQAWANWERERAKVLSPSDQHEWNPIPSGCETDLEICRHVIAALNTGHPQFCEYGQPREEVISICGSGPSLKDTWPKLTGDVWACNDAHKFLLERGVVPKFAMVWDPQGPDKRGSPYYCLQETHPDVTYLVASMCHPAVFDQVRDRKVIVWHPEMGETIPIKKWLEGAESPAKVTVGNFTSGAVGRSMQFAFEMGYRKMEIHGADGSTRDGYVHFEDFDYDHDPTIQRIDATCFGRLFFTTTQLYRQTQEMMPLVRGLIEGNGASVKFHGDGMIPHMARVMGWHVDTQA